MHAGNADNLCLVCFCVAEGECNGSNKVWSEGKLCIDKTLMPKCNDMIGKEKCQSCHYILTCESRPSKMPHGSSDWSHLASALLHIFIQQHRAWQGPLLGSLGRSLQV